MRKLVLAGLFLVGLIWAIASFSGLAAQGTYDRIVLDFREDVDAAQIEQQVQTIAQKYNVRPRLNSEFSQPDHLYTVKGDKALLNALKHDLKQYTEYVEPDYIYSIPESQDSRVNVSIGKEASPIQASQAPNDPMYSQQWNLHSINVESSWQDTKGKGATVAVIDTGISEVPDLKETSFAKGYDFVNDREDARDDNGHGTHVAGTIAQSTNNGFGVAGIAYEATLMPLKVLSASGGGTVADIAEAIRFAADHGANVINMSLGGGGESSAMAEAIDYAHKKGVLVIAAAGNSGQNSASYPARYPHVLGVAALDSSGQKADYSNFGAGVDVSAPGGSTSEENAAGGILQNTIDPSTGESTFAAFQGTSMAAPHVAGVAALVSASGVKDPDEVAAALTQSARKVQDDELNHYGAGKLDAAAAVKLALKGKITFNDFFQWLRDSGYLNPRFWIDGGVVALVPKLAMVVGSYLLAFFLRNYFPFAWSWSMASGLIAGSSGLFFLKGIYIFDLPQAPLRVMGSSIPELGSSIQGSGALNPLFASVLIPLALVVLLLGHAQWKWFAIGSTIGVTACLAVSAAIDPQLMWLGDGALARGFLIVNALLCYGLVWLAIKPGDKIA
ncbi:S8 family peptidase [Phormidesmis priestleyi]|uniref:S8 family peptidase n=1 Tax=Phormidesmis priestleyi TaxID=268141 RepID=UPI00083A11E7|nr:S8 family peptidase [Phormidesmis priestleyi]